MYKIKWIILLGLLQISCFGRREFTADDQQDSGARDSESSRTGIDGGAGKSAGGSGGSHGSANTSVGGSGGGVHTLIGGSGGSHGGTGTLVAGRGGAVGGISGTVLIIDAGGIDGGGTGSTNPAACASNETYCSNFGRCIELRSNTFACGSCTNWCTNGQACVNGSCASGTCVDRTKQPCTSPEGDSSCRDLTSDHENCGSCNHACNNADSCENGKCQRPDCGDLDYCADTGCVDTSTDISNCGSCGNVCENGSSYDNGAYSCNDGECGCSPLANTCGDACATQFWYCPPNDYTGSAADYCSQSARNSYERCACTKCLQQVQDCFGSASCVNAMDCALGNLCVGCDELISTCEDWNTGEVDSLAADLVDCINTQCG
jgi:hypothetical protein